MDGDSDGSSDEDAASDSDSDSESNLGGVFTVCKRMGFNTDSRADPAIRHGKTSMGGRRWADDDAAAHAL